MNYTGTAKTASGLPPGMMQSSGAQQSCPVASATSFYINEFGVVTSNPTMCFAQATGPISLKPGDRAVVYFQVPTGILSTVDSGSQSSVAIYAGNVGAPQSVTVESK